jgi:threonylcarbamoyladenosine tRNA methylthiotransferase MtaB
LVLGTAEKIQIAEFLENGSQGIHVSDICTFAAYPEARIEGHYGHTRALLKIQEGCNQACAFCIVPQARGTSRRRPLESVVEEAKRFIARGYKEIVLTGTHLDEENVFQAVTALEGVPGLRRLRVSSMDPNEISERLLGLLASLEKCCRHLHIAVQSGDDGTLERMRRPYGRRNVVSLLERIQEVLGEDVGIGADFLVGFPGEDERAFAHTYRLISEMPFTYLHLFPFSPRPSTVAFAMRPVFPQAMVRERLKALKELGERKRKEFQERFIDREVEVLVEHRCEKGKDRLTGLTDNYLRVFFEGPEAIQGRLAKILITGQEDGRLIGRVKA